MSPLFSIMSLFTEDVRRRHSEDDNSEPSTAAIGGPRHPRHPLSADFRKPHDIPISFPNTPQFGTPGESRESDAQEMPRPVSNGGALPHVPPMTLEPFSLFCLSWCPVPFCVSS